jgi:hypothetical protein
MSEPSTLSVENKVKLINEVLLPLRSYQMIGHLEARKWIEVLFPEFGEIRDRELDQYLARIAEETSNNLTGEDVYQHSE